MSEERQQAEEHLVKMESRLQEVLHKFELEAKRQHGDFATQYSELTPEDGPKVSFLSGSPSPSVMPVIVMSDCLVIMIRDLCCLLMVIMRDLCGMLLIVARNLGGVLVIITKVLHGTLVVIAWGLCGMLVIVTKDLCGILWL